MAAIPNNPPPGGPGGAVGGGAGAPPPNPPSNTGRIGRALAGIASFLGRNAANWTAEEVQARWDGLTSLLWVSILVPTALFVLGLAVGRIGVWLDVNWLITTATGIFALGSLLGALSVTYLWVKIMVYTQGVVLFSESARALSDAFPAIPRARVDTFLIWLRGWTAWYIGALLTLTYVPVYRSITLAMLYVGALLLMAAIMSACWNSSPWPRRIMTIFAVCAITGLIFQLSAPSTYNSMRNWSVSLVDGVTSWGDRQNRVVEVERSAAEREDVQDAQRLDLIRARQTEIRQRVLDESCIGAFCTPGDRAEYQRLQREAERLIAGTMRESEPPSPARTPTAQPAPPVRAAGASHLPPPPPPVDRGGDVASSRRHRPRSPAAAKRGSPGSRARGPSGLPRVTNDELDDIFFPIHQ